MQPEFHSGVVTRPAQRHSAAGDDGLPCAAGPGSLLLARVRPCWGGIAVGRPPLGRARGGGLVAQGRGGRCVVSLDAFLSRGCEKARFGALRAFPPSVPTCFTCSEKSDRAVLVLQACDGALFLVSLDTILS